MEEKILSSALSLKELKVVLRVLSRALGDLAPQ